MDALDQFGVNCKKTVWLEEIRNDRELAYVCSRAKVVWSPTVATSEPDAMALAAQVCAPFVGCDSLPSRDAAAELGLKPLLYRRGDARAAAELIDCAAQGETQLGKLTYDPGHGQRFVRTLLENARVQAR
jgi:hypothetical protein